MNVGCASCFCSGVVVSAGIFRVFGSEMAELPLVATVTDFQGQVVVYYTLGKVK